jgi:hypothetical protein
MRRRPNIDHVRAAANQNHVWPPGTTTEKEDDDWIVLVEQRT